MLPPIALLEEREQLAAEHAAEHADGEEESAPGGNPAGVIEGHAAGGNETVQVRMMSQVLRQVCSTASTPMCAPRWRESAAISSRVSEAARNSNV